MKTDIGHYQLVSELGRGGMGVVYKAYEPALERYVAIKELSSSLSHDPDLVQRFVREARAMAALNDPHIIQIHFIGQDGEQPYFAMEFVDGESLSSLLEREGRLKTADALKICQQAARGLATAHSNGVIHRDIKPSNLMINKRDQLKIADFGIAFTQRDFSKKLTVTGDVVGTPGYLSPEVCLGNPVDARSDLFALGIVLYEMLSGQIPFNDPSPLKLMLSVVESALPDIRQLNHDIDADTVVILNKLLAKNPDDRYQSADALLKAIAVHHEVLDHTMSVHARLPAGAASTQLATPGMTKVSEKKSRAEQTHSSKLSSTALVYPWAKILLPATVVVALFSVSAMFWFNGSQKYKATKLETIIVAKEPINVNKPEQSDEAAQVTVAAEKLPPMGKSALEKVTDQKPVVPNDHENITATVPDPPNAMSLTNQPLQTMEKYGEVYVGTQNERISVAQVSEKQIAYVKIVDTSSPYDGKIIRTVLQASAYEGTNYTMQYEGKDYVVLAKRKYNGRPMQVELFLPGITTVVKLTYDSGLSKVLKTEAIRDEFASQK